MNSPKYTFPDNQDDYEEYVSAMEEMANHVESTIPDSAPPHICPMDQKTRQSLVSAAIRYDEKQQKGKRWNPYALPQYISRIEEIEKDVANGASLRDAICAGFTGSLLNAFLRAVKLEKPSDDEWTGRGKVCYTPAAK